MILTENLLGDRSIGWASSFWLNGLRLIFNGFVLCSKSFFFVFNSLFIIDPNGFQFSIVLVLFILCRNVLETDNFTPLRIDSFSRNSIFVRFRAK